MVSWLAAVAASTAICALASLKRALSPSGVAAAWLIGVAVVRAGTQWTSVLLAFFVSSTLVTRLGHRRKHALDPDYKPGGARNCGQVAGAGLAAALCCAAYVACRDLLPPSSQALPPCRMPSALLASFTASGDTWASELGILSRTAPVLVTTWRRVPAGTNGGVTVLGTVASAAGGVVVGLALWATSGFAGGAQCVALGLFGGLVGSLLDRASEIGLDVDI
eukprot:m51a1_g11374 hypothetical protein (221) ;mRNA; r:21515-23585